MNEMNKNPEKNKIIKIISAVAGVLILAFCTYTGIRAVQFNSYSEASELSVDQTYDLGSLLLNQYGDRYGLLKKLPYSIGEQRLDVWAKSAILIDTANGNILYEKNADEVIPPASMTKLFVLYVVDEEVSAGNLSYNQLIPLPPESWACNMPPHSSLMFLGKGQKVTLEELLIGLSVCSGNDAAYALAYTICGSMEDFVERMNQVAADLGLINTHFVESSGYSELNTTTAREMAAFCNVYLQKHPDSLARYHGVQSFTYPKEQNMADGDRPAAQDFSHGLPEHITMPITQKNTNPLLGILDGVDGLKTGYIDESGYNLSLTAKRKGTRFLSVTMRGPGNTSKEGQQGRVHDGTELMEWAFSTFADYSMELYNHPYFIKAFCGKEKGLNLIPAYNDKILTAPYITGNSMDENLSLIKVYVNLPDYTWGTVEQGQVYGSIKFTLNDYLLEEIPLLADRNIKKTGFVTAMADKILVTLWNSSKNKDK